MLLEVVLANGALPVDFLGLTSTTLDPDRPTLGVLLGGQREHDQLVGERHPDVGTASIPATDHSRVSF